MNRIEKKFKELKARRRKAFVAYITAGDPDLAMTGRIALELERSGVDVIELGIPFSDPLADGATIQAASQRALKKKVNLKKVFVMVGSLRKRTQIPIAFMTYYNPVLKYGLNNFIAACGRYGVDGVIIPDLPHDEAELITALARKRGVATIFLIAPTSTPRRIREIAKASEGFIYYVSLTGVTGARTGLQPEVISKVRQIRALTRKPVCVGFGVSGPKQARMIAEAASGVIIGSAIVNIIGENQGNSNRLLSKVFKFSESLAIAIHNA